MKRFLLLSILIMTCSITFGQVTKHTFFQKIDALGNYNINNQKTYWDTLAVAIPFMNMDRDITFNGAYNFDIGPVFATTVTRFRAIAITSSIFSSAGYGFVGDATGIFITPAGTSNTGAILYRNSSGYQVSLNPSGNGKVLTTVAGIPSWETPTTSGITNIGTTSPITGGPITSTGTIGIDNAAADGATKGAASFDATYFDASGGNIVPDFTNGLASGSQSGYLGTGTQTIAGVKTFSSSPIFPIILAGDNSTKGANTAYVDQYTQGFTPGTVSIANSSGVMTATVLSGGATVNSSGVVSLDHSYVRGDGNTTLTANSELSGSFDFGLSGHKRFYANGTYTTTANFQYANEFSGATTLRATTNDVAAKVRIGGTMVSGVAGQNADFLLVDGTFPESAGAFTNKRLVRIAGAINTWQVDANGRQSTDGGISMVLGTGTSSGNIFTPTGTFAISHAATGKFTYTAGTITNQQTQGFVPSVTFAPTSGTGTYDLVNPTFTANQTSTANGAMSIFKGTLIPTGVLGDFTFFESGATANINSASGKVRGLWFHPPTGGTAPLWSVVAEPPASLAIFGGSTPTSTLQTAGSFGTGYVAKTGAYTLTSLDYTVEVTSGTHTQTLPTAVGITGRIYVITNSGSGTVTVGTTSSQTFVNVVATPTTLILAQFNSVTVQSNGANWLRISSL